MERLVIYLVWNIHAAFELERVSYWCCAVILYVGSTVLSKHFPVHFALSKHSYRLSIKHVVVIMVST